MRPAARAAANAASIWFTRDDPGPCRRDRTIRRGRSIEARRPRARAEGPRVRERARVRAGFLRFERAFAWLRVPVRRSNRPAPNGLRAPTRLVADRHLGSRAPR